MLVLRITNGRYILIEEEYRETVLKELMERWDIIFEEARWGSIDQAMELYADLFEWLDQLGRRVSQYAHRADVVLPPRDLDVDELKSLLGRYRR